MEKYIAFRYGMVRTPLLGIDEYPNGITASQTREKLIRMVSNSAVREALQMGSLEFERQIDRWIDAVVNKRNIYSDKTLRDVEKTLIKYAIRITTRPTPFGSFAGVNSVEVSDDFSMEIGNIEDHYTVTQIDLENAWSIVREIEENQNIMEHVNFYTNPLSLRYGERFYLVDTNKHGMGEIQSASIRATPVSKIVLQTCCDWGADLTTICAKLEEKYESIDKEQVIRLMKSLMHAGFIYTNVRPNLEEDACEKILNVAHFLSDDYIDYLDMLQRLIVRLDKQPLGMRSLTRNALKAIKNPLGETRHTTRADMTTHLVSNHINNAIAKEAACAFELLARITPIGKRRPNLDEYRKRFIEHYGQREVPILELINDKIGIGAPKGYKNPPPIEYSESIQPDFSERNRLLMQLAVRGENEEEIELTEQDLKAIENASNPDDRNWEKNLPETGEIFVQILSESQEEISKGNFSLLIGPSVATSMAGKAFGRFNRNLQNEVYEEFRKLYRQIEDSNDILNCEISYLPINSRIMNVATRSRLYSYEIAIGIPPKADKEYVVGIQDILVGVNGGDFYLCSRSKNKQIRVHSSHMLANVMAPNIVRFMEDISRSSDHLFWAFDWGLAENLHYTPRVRFGRIILSPRTWNISVNKLPKISQSQTDEELVDEVDRWRNENCVDNYITIGSNDNLLIINLENPLHIRVFCDNLNKILKSEPSTTYIKLREVLVFGKNAWSNHISGEKYCQEFIIPLALRDVNRVEKYKIQKYYEKSEKIEYERCKTIGDDWIYIKLYESFSSADDLISCDIFNFIREESSSFEWFFIRYADPRRHIRLRIRPDPDSYAKLLTEIFQWIKNLKSRGLIRDAQMVSYDREIERYGGEIGMVWSERFFHQDSETILNIMREISQIDQESYSLDKIGAGLLNDSLVSAGLNLEKRLQTLQTIIDSQKAYYDGSRSETSLYLRKLVPELPQFLSDTWCLDRFKKETIDIIIKRRFAMTELLNKIYPQVEDFQEVLINHLHMTCNRLGFNRYQEYRLYVAILNATRAKFMRDKKSMVIKL